MNSIVNGNELMKKIDALPKELVGEIFDFLPLDTLKLTNKSYYKTHNIQFIENIERRKYNFRMDSYIKFILRNDHHYLFGLLYHDYHQKWKGKKKWKYKNVYFDSIFDYIKHLGRYKYKSHKCIMVIENENISASNNKFVRYCNKKIPMNNSRWTN